MRKYILSLLMSVSVFAEVRLGDVALRRIVVPKDAADTVVLAGRELQSFLEKVAGNRLEIVNAAEGSGNIVLGEQADMSKDVLADGYIIKAMQGNLYISGRDQKGVVFGIRNPWNRNEVYSDSLKLGAFGECGTLYGVYAFLEEFAGVRFYMPGEIGTVVPKKDVVVPAGVDKGNSPKFSYRHPWICNFNVAPDEALWYKRAGFGGKAPVQIIDFNGYITRAFKDTHPEYLALVDGERDSTNKCAVRGGGSLCYSAPGCKEAVAALIIDYFRKHPEHSCFPLVPGDGYIKCCECENCQKKYDINAPKSDSGRFSYIVWDFVNEVAKIVGKEFPDKFVGCLAYDSYLAPPKEIDKFDPHVAIMFCRNRSSMASPVYAKAMHERIEGWMSKTDNSLYGWDYYLHCWTPWRELPVFFPTVIQEDLKYMLSHGFSGEFIEAESWRSPATPTKMNYPATQHLNLYVTGKLYWNPNADLNAMLEEYYTLFYGPAAKPMKEFFTLAMDRWLKGLRTTTSSDGIGVSAKPADVFPVESLDRMLAKLEEAERIATESPYKERIQLMQKEFQNGRRTLVVMVRDEKPVLDSLKTDEMIKIDGVMDEPAWALGHGSPMVSKTGETTPLRTYIYSRHDDSNIYFGFILYESRPDKLKVSSRERDYAFIYEDDCVEAYVINNDGKGYQFIVSPGALWDAEINTDQTRNVKWDSGAQSAVTVNGNRICMELSIPLQSIGVRQGDSFTANFYRSRVVDVGQTFAAWSPIFQEMHYKPERFGKVVLK